MARDNRVVISIEAKNARRTQQALKRIGVQSREMGGQFQKTSRMTQFFNRALITLGTTIATYVSGRVLINATKEFAKFEKELANIQILLDKNVQPTMERFRKGVDELSVQFGIAANKLTTSLFDVQSATGDASTALNKLEAATRLAVAGGSNLEASTKGLLTIMSNYGEEVRDTADAADLLFLAQKRARATVGQLSDAAGRFIPLARQLNLTLEEQFAVFSELTVGMGDVNEASTNMKGLLASLIKPTEKMKEHSQDLYGMSIQRAVAEKGLITVLEDLFSVEDELIGKLVENREALVALGVSESRINEIKRDSIELTERSGTVNEALKGQLDTTQKSLDIMGQTWHRLNRNLGEFIAKKTPIVDTLKHIADGLNLMINPEEETAFEKQVGNAMDKLQQLEARLERFQNLPSFLKIFAPDVDESKLKQQIEKQKRVIQGLFTEKDEQEGEQRRFDMQAEYLNKRMEAREEMRQKETEAKAKQIAEEAKQEKKWLNEWQNIQKTFTKYQLQELDTQYEKFREVAENKLEVDRWYQEQKKEIMEKQKKENEKASDSWLNDFQSSFIDLESMAEQTAQNMQSAFSNLFFNVFTGQLDNARSIFENFGQSVLRMLTDILAQMAVMGMVKSIGGLFGGIVGGGSSGSSGSSTPTVGHTVRVHSGGKIAGKGTSPIFAHGGLAPDEVPAVLQTGEGVLNRNGMSLLGQQGLNDLNRGSSPEGGGGGVNINIVMPIQAWDSQDVWRNRKALSNAIADEIRTNGAIREVIRQYG